MSKDKELTSYAKDANMVHIDAAAQELGISTRTIRRMIKQHQAELRAEHVDEVIELTVQKLMVSLTDLTRLRQSSARKTKTAPRR